MPKERLIPHKTFMFIVAIVAALVILPTVDAGAVGHASLDSYSPTRASYTGIDPGAGQFYSYAPSTVQTNATTRYAFYCGNSPAGKVLDHIMLSVGHLANGHWQYSRPKIVFGPEDGPSNSFFVVHTCEPEVIGGQFKMAGTPYKWAMFFTAEAVASNSTNVIGMAFANSLAGPWHPDLTPLVQTSDDFGNNSFPNHCPVDPQTGQTFYCLGEPAATTIGGGRVLLTYMGNSGSPGNASNPAEGLVYREISLANVPATGPCTTCFLNLPTGGKVAAVTPKGLATWPHDVSIAYDPGQSRVAMSFDNGPTDTTIDGPPVTPVVTEATIGLNGLLHGNGSWNLQGNVGQCLTGFTYSHNSGIVRTANGDLPSGGRLEVLFATANNNLGGEWGVWGYRLWDVSASLTGGPNSPTLTAATASCPGLTLVDAGGHVSTGGSAQNYGSLSSPPSVPVGGFALTPDRRGYYLVSTNGQVKTFGDARNRGSAAPSSAPGGAVVGLAVDASTGGYWVARADGTVTGFGAPSLGSLAISNLSGPVEGIVTLPSGEGYYLYTAGGIVGAFGSATSYGSFARPPGQTVATMATTPDGHGYYLVTRQGTIAAFGSAQLFGPPVVGHSAPVAALALSTDGFGYTVVSSTGVTTSYGDANGSLVAPPTGGQPVVALEAS